MQCVPGVLCKKYAVVVAEIVLECCELLLCADGIKGRWGCAPEWVKAGGLNSAFEFLLMCINGLFFCHENAKIRRYIKLVRFSRNIMKYKYRGATELVSF